MRIYSVLAVFLFSLICLGGLNGCVGTGVNWDTAAYTVRSGDTLYSIAWRYEIDHEDLASWNRLSSPYLIHPGDRLQTRSPSRLRSASGSTRDDESGWSAPASQQGVRSITVKQGDTLYSLAKKNYMPAWKLAMINGLKQPYVLRPGQTLRLSGQAVAVATTRKVKTQTARVQTSTGSVVWHWPVRGKIVGKFNRWKNDAKGIDIAGRKGAAIHAAAPGKVVYSGNSLINYGHLVIIKHNRDFLSAYANNRKLLVSEGEMVTAGQKIAELGEKGAKTPRLHFEIRKKGKPVDPLRYLPGS